jgi:xanthine/uracil permease
MKNIITEKLKESFTSIIPITLVVLIACIICNNSDLMGLLPAFLIGCVFLAIGMSIFDLGVNISMLQIGSKIGKSLTKKNNVFIMLLMCFIIATIITIAEPDLLVLSGQTPNVPPLVLILSVGVGVGLFFLLGCTRILRKWN